jgi:hypothetical protein
MIHEAYIDPNNPHLREAARMLVADLLDTAGDAHAITLLLLALEEVLCAAMVASSPDPERNAATIGRMLGDMTERVLATQPVPCEHTGTVH